MVKAADTFLKEDETLISKRTSTTATEIDQKSSEDNKKDITMSGSQISGILTAKNMMNALSKSGVREEMNPELAEKARKVWKGWQVNLNDVEFVRKPTGDRQRIGNGAAADF